MYIIIHVHVDVHADAHVDVDVHVDAHVDVSSCSHNSVKFIPHCVILGFKESAYLHAITSASLVYTIARACSTNRLTRYEAKAHYYCDVDG